MTKTKIEKVVEILSEQGYIDEDEKAAIVDCFWVGAEGGHPDLISEEVEKGIESLTSKV